MPRPFDVFENLHVFQAPTEFADVIKAAGA